MILLSLSIIGFILSAILLYFNARKFPASVYLGALFFLVSLYGFIQWILYYSDSLLLVGIFYSNFSFLAFIIGPLLLEGTHVSYVPQYFPLALGLAILVAILATTYPAFRATRIRVTDSFRSL